MKHIYEEYILDVGKFFKSLILFAVEINELETTLAYESIGDGTNNNNNTSSSPDNSDDFVLVPNNLPVALPGQAYDKK